MTAAWRPGVYVDGLGYNEDVPGEPVSGAFEALVRIYETRAALALAGGGEDPFMEAAWRYHETRVRDPDGPPMVEDGGLHGSLRRRVRCGPRPRRAGLGIRSGAVQAEPAAVQGRRRPAGSAGLYGGSRFGLVRSGRSSAP